MNYIHIFHAAWKNYQQLSERKHGTIKKSISSDYFASFRNSNRDINQHPALRLQSLLTAHKPNDPALKEQFVKFLLEKPPENNNSFSSYLIDELMAQDPAGGWELFEREPVLRFSSQEVPLYRGVKYDPKEAFAKGITQHYSSNYLEPYTSSQNGGIGNSTSLSYDIAFDYAAPKQEHDPEVKKAMMHCKKLYGSSYIYVIHYRGHQGIDIPNTHLARNNLIQYATCSHEAEINIAEDISNSDIYCAIEIERSSRTIKNIFNNPDYKEDENTAKFKQQYNNHNNPVFDLSHSEKYTFSIKKFTIENVYSSLHELSKTFIQIKYDAQLTDANKSQLLKNLRLHAYSELKNLLSTVDDHYLKSDIVHHAIKLKIFSEHKKASITNSLFSSNTKAQDSLLNSLAQPAKLSTHPGKQLYITRVM